MQGSVRAVPCSVLLQSTKTAFDLEFAHTPSSSPRRIPSSSAGLNPANCSHLVEYSLPLLEACGLRTCLWHRKGSLVCWTLESVESYCAASFARCGGVCSNRACTRQAISSPRGGERPPLLPYPIVRLQSRSPAPDLTATPEVVGSSMQEVVTHRPGCMVLQLLLSPRTNAFIMRYSYPIT